jgi:K+-sensing histidine kinase KdpD
MKPRQISLNFTSNAIKYNRAGGQVYVHGHEVSFDGKTALYEFVCEDTGIGMSEEFQNRAFDPFTQEERDDARTTYVGTGLGLSITKQLIDLMGGTIPIIAMTANAFTDDMQKSLEAGMNAHLTKALKESSIVKAIVKYVK